MDKDINGTPFPTGLFKSRLFLIKVRKALDDGVGRLDMLPSARAPFVRVSGVRTAKDVSGCGVKMSKAKAAKGLRARYA